MLGIINCSCGSKSVPSPFHLSWLCLVEYLDLFVDEEVSILFDDILFCSYATMYRVK